MNQNIYKVFSLSKMSRSKKRLERWILSVNNLIVRNKETIGD